MNLENSLSTYITVALNPSHNQLETIYFLILGNHSEILKQVIPTVHDVLETMAPSFMTDIKFSKIVP
jgi:hypothetical protein